MKKLLGLVVLAYIFSCSKPSTKPVVIATWGQNTAAVDSAVNILNNKGSSLDAIEHGAWVPESDTLDTSVGYGGLPDRDGHVTLDACIMNSEGKAGSVTFVEGFKHPISIARAVMEKTPHVMLSGKGAEQFAESLGFKKENLLTYSSNIKYHDWLKTSEYKPKINAERHDTIGMLGLDNSGNLAGGCTTSGLAYKMHGRVGDSPIIGAGLYVDNQVGAAVATGLGETVMRSVGAFLAVELLRNGHTAQEAAQMVVERIAAQNPNTKDYQVGLIVLDKNGNTGAFAIQKGFNYVVFANGKRETIESQSLLQ